MNDLIQTPSAVAPVMAEFDRLRTLAKQGDQSILPLLQTFLDDHPEIWLQIGDLAKHVRESLLTVACGDELTAVESIRRKMQKLQEELVGESTSPMVQLLAEQCVTCWAQLNLAEMAIIGKEMNAAPRNYDVQRRLNAIQHRYLRALKTLATVRRLMEPTAAPIQPALKLVTGSTEAC